MGLAAVRNYRAAAGVFGATATAFATLLFALGAQQVDRHQTSNVIIDAIYQLSDDPQIASYKILEPSWVFYCGRPILSVTAPQARGNDQNLPDVTRFLVEGPNRFVITTDRYLEELNAFLPSDVVVLAHTGRFLKDEELVLLGRPQRQVGITASTESRSSYFRGNR